MDHGSDALPPIWNCLQKKPTERELWTMFNNTSVTRMSGWPAALTRPVQQLGGCLVVAFACRWLFFAGLVFACLVFGRCRRRGGVRGTVRRFCGDLRPEVTQRRNAHSRRQRSAPVMISGDGPPRSLRPSSPSPSPLPQPLRRGRRTDPRLTNTRGSMHRTDPRALYYLAG